ncbi:MAG: flagellar hook basal-body protein [Hydrogenothermaceae bacterium]|nr:flagellar hook basal-body protein [Hydrogenothermaceae bacterium]
MAVNFQPVYILASGGERALEQLSTATNNISNANTTGFKKLLVREMSQKIPENLPPASDLFVFPRFMDSPTLNKQGNLIKTDNPLDVAIEGDGFFTVETGVGRLYTRNGHFNISSDGFLVTSSGGYLLDENGNRIRVNQNGRIDITREGFIYQDGQQIGKLRVVNLQNLSHVGDSYYTGQESPAGNFKINQGYLENSNVEIVKEMVNLINSHRRFDIYMNLVKSLDMLEGKVNDIGKA